MIVRRAPSRACLRVCAWPSTVPPGPAALTTSRASVSSSTSMGRRATRSAAEDLVVDHELLRREAVERREDAGGVQHVLRAGAEDGVHGQRRLDAGLGVGHVRVGDGAAGAHRDAQPVAEPHGGLHERPVGRRADHERAALHGRERRRAAVEERRARVGQLRQHEADEQLGVLHGEEAGQRDRRRRPAHGADGDEDGLAEARQPQGDLRALRRELQRRRGVDDRPEARLRVPVRAVQDLEHVRGHLELGQGRHRVAAVLVARGRVQVGDDFGPPLLRHVVRLDAVAEDVDVGREVREPHRRRQVGERAGAVLAAAEDEGRAGGARQHGGLAEPDVQVELRPPAGDV